MEPRADTGRRRPGRARLWIATDRPVSAAGGDRSGARRSGDARGDRLDRNRRVVRRLDANRSIAGDRAQSCGSSRHAGRAGTRAQAHRRNPRAKRADGVSSRPRGARRSLSPARHEAPSNRRVPAGARARRRGTGTAPAPAPLERIGRTGDDVDVLALLLAFQVGATDSLSQTHAARGLGGVGGGAQLDSQLTRFSDSGFSGAVLVVRDRHIVLLKGYGLADAERGIRNTPATRFEMNSMT